MKMSQTQPESNRETAVDDVRRVREKIAAQHGGDLRAHMEETNRIFEQWREKLKLKVVPSTERAARHTGAPR